MTQRVADWPERLAVVIADWRSRPFRWGQSDCVHFAAVVLTSVRGQNWQALDFGHYTSRRSAQAELRKLGFSTLPDAVSALIGPARCDPHAVPLRGDLVAIPTAFGPALGVCLGAHLAAPGPQGLSFLSLSKASLSWRV